MLFLRTDTKKQNRVGISLMDSIGKVISERSQKNVIFEATKESIIWLSASDIVAKASRRSRSAVACAKAALESAKVSSRTTSGKVVKYAFTKPSKKKQEKQVKKGAEVPPTVATE